MTEKQWLKVTQPEAMWQFVANRSERKRRLLAVAFCRRIWDYLHDERSRKAVEVAERFADRKATEAQLSKVCGDASEADAEYHAPDPPVPDARPGSVWCVAAQAATDAATPAVYLKLCYEKGLRALQMIRKKTAERDAAMIVREVFGNPFRKVAFDKAWRTSDVMLLAQGIYAEKAFDRMPILADALQDAGCDSADILEHLRDPQATHVRGCWALDLVLGKE